MAESLTVTVLGASGSYAGPGGACTGFLVRSASTSVWLDAGPGTFANLQHHVRLGELSAMVLTHEHPDHWVELPVVCSALKHYEPRPPLPVYGTAGNLELAERLSPGLAEIVDWQVVSGDDRATIGDQEWRFSRTDHYVETLGIRVDAHGRSFGFTADTGPDWSVAELGEGIDLVVSESTFLSDLESEGILHLSARQAGRLAAEAGVGRLVLSHLAPGADADAHRREAEESFGAPVAVAAIGDTYEI